MVPQVSAKPRGKKGGSKNPTALQERAVSKQNKTTLFWLGTHTPKCSVRLSKQMLCLLLECSGSVFGCLVLLLGVSMFKTCQASLQVLNQKLKNTRAQQKRQTIHDSRLGLYRACDADAAVALYILSGYDAEIAGKFAMERTRWNRRKRNCELVFADPRVVFEIKGDSGVCA